MKKYLLKDGIRGIFAASENEEYDVIDYFNSHMDWPYFIEEPGTLTYMDRKGNKQTIDVKADSVVIKFYNGYDLPHDVVVIDSPEWVENIKADRANALKRAEKAKSEAISRDAQQSN